MLKHLQQIDGVNPDVVVGYALVAIAILWALGALVVMLAKVDRPRSEAPTDLLERLDREAPTATQPASSARKAGRTAVTR